MVPDRIERDTWIDAPIERVWRVLTEPRHIPSWFGGASAEIDLRPGGAIVFHWRAHGTFHARIEALDPPRLLVYRWALPPDQAPRPGNSTRVEMTLAVEGTGTRLRIIESGFASLEGSDAERAEHVGNNRQGWAGATDGLVAYAPGAE